MTVIFSLTLMSSMIKGVTGANTQNDMFFILHVQLFSFELL